MKKNNTQTNGQDGEAQCDLGSCTPYNFHGVQAWGRAFCYKSWEILFLNC